MDKEEAIKTLKAHVGYDRILETSSCCDYYQFIVIHGGDVYTYRVYDDGDICEK